MCVFQSELLNLFKNKIKFMCSVIRFQVDIIRYKNCTLVAVCSHLYLKDCLFHFYINQQNYIIYILKTKTLKTVHYQATLHLSMICTVRQIIF